MKIRRSGKSYLYFCFLETEIPSTLSCDQDLWFDCQYRSNLFSNKRKTHFTDLSAKIHIFQSSDNRLSKIENDILLGLTEDTFAQFKQMLQKFTLEGLFQHGELGEIDYDKHKFEVYLIGF